MTAAQRTKLKKKLVALQRELSGKGPISIEPNRVSEGEVGTHEDEQPLNEMLQSIASSRNRNLQGVLSRVEVALKKLAETPDDYGVCEECGEAIGLARLEAMPYAEFCIICQDQRDGPRGRPTRTKITDYR